MQICVFLANEYKDYEDVYEDYMERSFDSGRYHRNIRD